ncbi:MAG: thiamine-phosphate kinase [Halioglobus sp.]
MPASEFSLIYRYFSSLGQGDAVDLGVGDDCALLQLGPGERLATSIDTLVADVHFFADSFPEDIGYRCIAVALSDLAAMGARPLGMTLALTLPEVDEFWLHAFSEGVAQASAQYGLPLVGGDTTAGPLTVSVSVMGAVPCDKALLRSGAKVGDSICVTGTLGDAAAAVDFLRDQWQPTPEVGEFILQQFNRPQIPLALSQALLSTATACIDVSDGLLADAGHIASASGVKMNIDPSTLPLSAALTAVDDRDAVLRWALAGGDDYQLCFCLPEGEIVPPGATCIGSVSEGEGVDCGMEIDFPAGYQHFGQ